MNCKRVRRGLTVRREYERRTGCEEERICMRRTGCEGERRTGCEGERRIGCEEKRWTGCEEKRWTGCEGDMRISQGVPDFYAPLCVLVTLLIRLLTITHRNGLGLTLTQLSPIAVRINK